MEPGMYSKKNEITDAGMELIKFGKPVLFRIRLAQILNNIYLVDDIIPLFNKLAVSEDYNFKIDTKELE